MTVYRLGSQSRAEAEELVDLLCRQYILFGTTPL